MSLTFVQAEMQVVSKGDDNPRSRSEWLKMGKLTIWFLSTALTALRNQQACQAKSVTKNCLGVCFTLKHKPGQDKRSETFCPENERIFGFFSFF